MHFVRLARSGHVTVPAHQQTRHTGITHIITPSTTTTTTTTTTTCPHTTPLSPPLLSPTHHISARTHHMKLQEYQNSPKTPPRWPCWQQHDNMKWGGHNTLKTRWTWRNTQWGTRRGQRGTEKQQAGHTRYTHLFFLFFCVYWHPPLS